MATLTNTKIKDTYDGLLKTTDNDVIGITEKVITDGLGNASILSIGTQSASFSEDIEINGQTFGVGLGSVSSNVAIGFDSLSSNTTGSYNVAIGNASALSNTTGARNIAIGFNLLGNTTGNDNISLGLNSLYFLTGSDNIAIGRAAGQYSTGTLNKTAGDQNIYIGANTVSGGQDTDNEIIIGYNTTGNGSNTATYGNTSITDHYFDGNVRADFFYGDGSNLTNLPVGTIPTLQQVTTSGATTTDSITVGGLTAASLIYPSTDGTSGQVISTDGAGNLTFTTVSTSTPSLDQVTAVGATSSVNVTINGADLGTIGVSSNTLFGYNALASHTSGSDNTAIGYQALDAKTVGNNNVAIGRDALGSGTTVANNTAIGNLALANISGNYNVALGFWAGKSRVGGNKTLGDNNIYIGSNTLSSAADTDNEIVIGANATGNGSNSATYGDSNVTKHIFTAGNVGIGEPIPASKLYVNAGSDNYAAIFESTDATSLISFKDNNSASILANYVGVITNDLVFGTNSAERMRITSDGDVYFPKNNGTTLLSATDNFGSIALGAGDGGSGTLIEPHLFVKWGGNVGIGTSSPTQKLSLQNSGSTYLSIDTNSAAANAGILLSESSSPTTNGAELVYDGANNKFHIKTGAASFTERLTIERDSGNVGIGGTPTHKLYVRNDVGASTDLDPTSIKLYNNSDGGAAIEFSNGVAGNSKLSFGVEGTGGLTDESYIGFSTSANGATATERMRITSGGDVLIGKQSLSAGTAGFEVEPNGIARITKSSDFPLLLNRLTTTGTITSIRYNSSPVGSISVTTTATAYNTSSDYRLKENVVDMTGALDRVDALKPSRFNFIADPEKTVDGFLAHEVQAIVPEAVTGEKDAVDEEGNPIYQGIDQSKIVPLLVGAIKELRAEVESLKSQLS